MALSDHRPLRNLNDSWPQRVARHHHNQPDDMYDLATQVSTQNRLALQLAAKMPTLTHQEMRAEYTKQKQRTKQIWRDYVRTRDQVRPTSDATLVTLKLAMWVCYVRCTLLEKQLHEAIANGGEFEIWPACLARTATDFAFVQLISARRSIAVSTQCIGGYSVRTLMLALTALVDALDSFGWTPSATAYFFALYWRYALMVHLPGEYAVGDVGLFAAMTGVEKCRILRPAPVTQALLEVSERLVFHHLYRIQAQMSFLPLDQSRLGLNVVAARAWTAWRRANAVASFTTSMKAILEHDMLREDIGDRFLNLTIGRYLYPGELEQMQFTYPDEANGEASSALFRLRVDVYQSVTAMNRVAPLSHLVPYMQAILETTATDLSTDGTLEAHFDAVFEQRDWEHERLILLMFEVCFDFDCLSSEIGAPFCAHAYVDDRSVASPGDRPPVSVKNARAAMPSKDTWPLFIAIWNCYYVVRNNGPEPGLVLATPHLLDALGTWLAIASQEGHLKLSSLRGGWQACINNIPLSESLTLPAASNTTNRHLEGKVLNSD